MERWSGRVALVTGASSGIGAAIAVDLAINGMKVVGCARDVDRINKLAESVPKGSLYGVRCDLSKEDDIANLFKVIKEKYGRVDVCVNNAGVSVDTLLLSGKTEDWKDLLNVNVLALCICTRESIKLMQENNIDDGQIIHLSSLIGHKVVNGAAFYSGTKFMVRALTEGLRQELQTLKSHIRVASISPGVVKTEMMYRMFPNDKSIPDEFYKNMENLEAEDISSLVVTILKTPPRVNINDIIVRPVEQDSCM